MVREIGEWLDGLGLGRYAEAFADNEIDLHALPHITEEDLKEIGVALGARRKLLAAIAELGDSDAPATAEERSEERSASAEAERRQLTVMFVDLVGSTALSERLDPEDLREVIRAYQETCAEAVNSVEGHIAKYIGDGILVYFGYPQAHEDDARHAVQAGLGIVRGVEELNRQIGGAHGVELAVRVGVHTGLVVAGEMGGGGTLEAHAIVGETPNIAARLEGLAEPGTLAISEATHRLVEGLFVCAALGPRSLKGISEPVRVYRVEAEGEAPSRFEAGARRGLTPLVGREEEIGLLFKRWEQAKDGEGQVALLSGEPGVGKSRIIRGFRERIEGEPHNRILYYGSPYHRNSALYPLINQFQRALRFSKEDDSGAKLLKLEGVLDGLGLPVAEIAPPLAVLLSLPFDGRYEVREAGPEELRRQTIGALVSIVEAMAAQSPVLMVVEDAHLMDPSTLEYVNLLVEDQRNARILIIIAFRPEFEPQWAGHAHATLLTLNRVSRKESAAMVSRLMGGKDIPEEILDQIIAKTDGVPLFVEELAKTVLESDLMSEQADRYVVSGPVPALAIPASLQDSLTARLDRLGPVKEIAQLAATIGRTFSHDLLAAVSPLSETELAKAISTLVDAGLVHRRGFGLGAGYEFKHALVQDAAYQSLLKSTRQRFHSSIAQVIRDRFPETAETEPELLAHHYTEAGLHQEAVDHWQRAGEQAALRSANMEAVSHLGKGLELLQTLPNSPDRARQEFAMQIVLGSALMMTRGVVALEAERAYARARELAPNVDDPRERFKALWGHYFVFEIRAQWQDALDNTAELLDLAKKEGDTGLLLQAHHAAWTAHALHGDLLQAREHADRGWALYDTQDHHEHKFLFGGHDPGVCARSTGAIPVFLLGYPDQALRSGEEALALAETLAHPTSKMAALFFCALVRLFIRDFETAGTFADRAVALGTEHGNRAFAKMGTILSGRALSELEPGSGGAQRMMDVLAPARAKGRGGFLQSYYLGQLAEAYLRDGNYEQGLAAAAEASEAAAAQKEGVWLAELHRLKGDLLLAQSANQLAEAEASFAKAIEVARAQSAKSLELRAATRLARIWAEQGRRVEAREVLAPGYGWFTEGFDTPDLKEAKALLDELS